MEPILSAEEWATREFERCSDELVPGAARKLGEVLANRVGVASAERRAEQAALAMETGFAAKYRDPGYSPPVGDNGTPLSPLRRAIQRHGDHIDADAGARLHDRLAAELAGLPPARIAARLAAFLETGEGRRFFSSAEVMDRLARRPEPPKARPAPPSRAADGRFAEPPARKPARADML